MIGIIKKYGFVSVIEKKSGRDEKTKICLIEISTYDPPADLGKIINRNYKGMNHNLMERTFQEIILIEVKQKKQLFSVK